MGLEDRDWYRDSYREKEKKYGSDFSKSGRTTKHNRVSQNPYPQNPKLQYQNKRMEQNIIYMLVAAGLTYFLVSGSIRYSIGGPILSIVALAIDVCCFVDIKKDEHTDNSVHKLVNMLALVVVAIAIAFAAVASVLLIIAFLKQ